VTNLDTVPILEYRRGGGAQGIRIPGRGTGSFLYVTESDRLKVLEGLALGEDAELEFIARYVEESVFWAEDLAEEGVIKPVEPRPWDAHKGEFHWEEGDGDLHIPSEGVRRGGERRTADDGI